MLKDRVKFIDSSHQYFYNDRELISVSKFTKLFEKPKDWKAIATKYAKKNGHTAEYWQNLWKEKGEKSTVIGTLFHSIKENEFLALERPELFGSFCEILQCEHIDGVKWSIPIEKLQDNTAYPELIIYDVESGLSGQADKVIIANGTINIRDFKTDKVIDLKGWSSNWKKAETLKEPLGHIEHCNGNLYALKMSLYMYMLWKHNKHLIPGKLIIDHCELLRDEDGIPVLEDGKPIILNEHEIEVPYLKKEVLSMLEYYKFNLI